MTAVEHAAGRRQTRLRSTKLPRVSVYQNRCAVPVVRLRSCRVGAVLVLGLVLTACGAASPQPTPAGQLAPGTAEVTVNGHAFPADHHVRCRSEQFWTTVDIGTDQQGVQAVIHNAASLTTESVRIRNMADFTGSYWHGLSADARATAAGSTFTVAGIADGFDAANPSKRTTGSFEIKAAC